VEFHFSPFIISFLFGFSGMKIFKRFVKESNPHAAVGGVMGIGFARGFEPVNFSIVYKIMLYWILTVPAAAVTSRVIFKILQFI